MADPEFGEKRDCDEFVAPFQKLGPHVAALGLEFTAQSSFSKVYPDHILIAEHGSWNRSTPIGYRLTLVDLKNPSAENYQEFASGWLVDGKSQGRPVDLEWMPDGSLLLSDDYADAIYRIRYVGTD